MGRDYLAYRSMDARGAGVRRSMLARARDRRKSARRRTGYDRDRVDARYRIADDRGAWEPGAAEPRSLPRPDVARSRSLSQTGSPERAARFSQPRRVAVAPNKKYHEVVVFQRVRPHPRVTASPLSLEEVTNGSRECAPDDRLRGRLEGWAAIPICDSRHWICPDGGSGLAR